MLETPDQSSSTARSPTLGRLAGLEGSAADRGERALWLAGGGFRAALFHLGALTRLNELGLLGRLDTVGAIGGGAIAAALLAARVPWPLAGAYREWPEQVAEPLREIASRNARARAFLRKPLPGPGDGAALEERYARELVRSLGEPERGPRFVFGASGLTLGGLVQAEEDRIEWELGACAHPPGYGPRLVAETIESVRTDLDAFGRAEQAVLENHGYLLADAALRERGLAGGGGIEGPPPEPPHPRWMDEERVREALGSSSRRTALGRLRPRRPVRGSRRAEPAAAELEPLLKRHRPLLRYDSLESFRADSVRTICDLVAPGRCNTLNRADGELIAAAAPSEEGARLGIEFLRGPTYPNGEAARSDDYLDECGGSPAGDALALRGRDGCADVVYGRSRHDGEGRLWLQYWFFYYYDDKGLLGVEQHEGDWEMVQLRLGEDGMPDAATFARHSGAERLRWEEVGLASTEEGKAPVVYPARGSHASLSRPGSFEAPVLADHNNGLGALVRPRLEPIADDGPAWIQWPGRWGSTRRRQSFEADSPCGPRGLSHWWDPAELHREARPRSESAVGGLEPPPSPRVEARRESGLAVVSYRFPDPGDGQGEPARILAAPLATAGDANPCPTHSLAVEGREGAFAVQLPADRQWAGVRLSAASERGSAGETISAPFEGGRGQERAG